MRKLALFLGAVALTAAVVPARAETSNWATHAVASSQYSNGQAYGLLNPVFSLAGPIENVAFAVLEPTFPYVFCIIFDMTPCVPEDPPGLAGSIAGAAADAVAALPGQLVAAVEAFPGNLVNALTTVPNNIVYGNWAATQATGAPNTYPNCGDIPTAWAPEPSGPDPEALAVFYNPPVGGATRIDIYETNIGGFVTSVEVVQPDGTSLIVFSGPDTTACPGILSIPLAGAPTVAAVIIHTQKPGWEEIDAVAVVN